MQKRKGVKAAEASESDSEGHYESNTLNSGPIHAAEDIFERFLAVFGGQTNVRRNLGKKLAEG